MTRLARGVLLALPLLAAAPGCAPLAPYRGPVPAPGALAVFGSRHAAPDGNSEAAAGRAGGRAPGLEASAHPVRSRLVPGSADRARNLLGTLAVRADAESVVVIMYGDNRHGYRMWKRQRELRAAGGLFTPNPRRWPWGLIHVPVVLLEAIIPSLDGPRDLVARFVTHRHSGGREDAVLRAIKRSFPADLVVSSGDIVTDGRRGRLWEDYVARHRWMREHALYVGVPGNHDRTDDALGRRNWDAAMVAPPRPGHYWYALDLPDGIARFVFLDSIVLTDKYGWYPDSLERALAKAQLDWADSALAAPVRYRFLVLHNPMVGAGFHRRDWGPASGEGPAAARRQRLFEICRRRRVTAVWAGHEHLYQRAYVRSRDGEGFWHVTSAGGGAPLYRVTDEARAEALAQPLPRGMRIEKRSVLTVSEFNFCRLVIPRKRAAGPDRLPVDVFRVKGSGTPVALDHFDLARGPDRRR